MSFINALYISILVKKVATLYSFQSGIRASQKAIWIQGRIWNKMKKIINPPIANYIQLLREQNQMQKKHLLGIPSCGNMKN